MLLPPIAATIRSVDRLAFTLSLSSLGYVAQDRLQDILHVVVLQLHMGNAAPGEQYGVA